MIDLRNAPRRCAARRSRTLRRALAITAATLVACGGPQLKEHTVDLSKHVPATLEAQKAREGDPRTAKLRIWVDPGVRAVPGWKDQISDQVDYASQLLTPLIGVRLSIESWKDWDRSGDPHQALPQLMTADDGKDAHWVIGYVAPNDTAAKAMSELGASSTLGKHVIVRAWAETPETAALASKLPDLKEAERNEVLGAHRRHKQSVVLLHHLAITLGGIAEADPAWILHPMYSSKQASFADRTKELLTIGIDQRLAENPDDQAAKALLEAIEKSEWGGWIASNKDEVTRTFRIVLDKKLAGKTAADIPKEAYDMIVRIRELARRGDTQTALGDLDNVISAYPGNASLHQIKCEILLAKPGVADKATRAACTRAGELAPGDPTTHFLVGEALAKAGDAKAAREELAKAEPKIGNLSTPEDAWRRLIGIYHTMGALTWTEDAITKAKLDHDPIAIKVTQTRARYGVPRGTKLVAPEQEAALVAAVKDILGLVYKSKYPEANRAISSALGKWPGAPGVLAAKCDLELRQGSIGPARASCDKALATDANQAWALYLSGILDLKNPCGTKSGIERLKRAIDVDPELGQAWRTLAKAYQRTKDQTALDQLAKDYQARFGQPLPR